MIIKKNIDKKEIANMPKVIFSGNIIVIDTYEEANRAIMALSKEHIVGFDTETKPSFKRGIINKIALIQFATEYNAYLIRLNKIGLPDFITDFLANPAVIKVGLSIRDDFLSIAKRSEISPEGFVELQDYVEQFGIKEKSLQRIYALLFGERISKNQRLSNWENETLTAAQKNYASIDAWACQKIFRFLEGLKIRTNPF
ncbi:MAG TPA: 3'-5' exonuclease [Bacteroidaceae bacterium]|nr:3'-5' exonuclease [Bacteroidaceae bacterium]